MLTRRALTLVFTCILVALAEVISHASDPIAVYARIDRVVLSPEGQSPRTIQLFGVFSVAKPDDRNFYQPATAGYLYFTLPGDDPVALREWNDLKSVAGTKQVVAFGSRAATKARVRPLTQPPADPDTYAVGYGVSKISGRTDYAPIRALLDFRQ